MPTLFSAADFTCSVLAQMHSVTAPSVGTVRLNFGPIDWAVVASYLIFTTWIGHALAGKQATIRDFFLGGRKLPWYAVAGSSIATEISAVTFIGVPAVVFGLGGDFTYMQLGIIAGLLSRLFVAFVLVPQYYKRLVYSPYDYMGNQLGGGVRGTMTALFSFGQTFAQASRVYLTAVVLELILDHPLGRVYEWTGISPLMSSIIIIGIVAVLWTVIGGIATVIWTDVILFCVFVIGGLTALFVIAADLGGGFTTLFQTAHAGGKFRLFDLDPHFDPVKEFTIWTAAIGTLFGNVGAYGTDQLMAQRIFCCANQREAKKAVIAGYAGQLVTALMLLVGAGLWVFYKGAPAIPVENPSPVMRVEGALPQALPVDQWAHPLHGDARRLYEEKNDRIFPIFILSDAIPPGVTGLMIAGIFAAAISSFDSILAALSQTSINGIYLPIRRRVLRRSQEEEDLLHARDDAEAMVEQRHILRVSRGLVLFWAVTLCAVAMLIDSYQDRFGIPILQLALGIASWTAGALLAAFLLAWLPLRINGRGLAWAAPLSVACVISLRFASIGWWIQTAWVVTGTLVLSWIIAAFVQERSLLPRRLLRTPILLAGCALLLWLAYNAYFMRNGTKMPLAFSWWAMVGTFVAFIFGYLLADRKVDVPQQA
jgi:solute:Na+ symporter, SSS family